jgi:hypothetical protein
MAMLNNQRVFPIVLVHPNHGFFKMFGDPQITTAQGRRLRQWPGRPKTCFDWCPGVKTLEVTWTAQPLQNSYISPIIPYISGEIPHIYIHIYIYIYLFWCNWGYTPFTVLGMHPHPYSCYPNRPTFSDGNATKITKHHNIPTYISALYKQSWQK